MKLGARRSPHLLQQHPPGRVLGRGAGELRSPRARGARPARRRRRLRHRPAPLGARGRGAVGSPRRWPSSATSCAASACTSSRSTAFPTAPSTARGSRRRSTCPDWRDPERLRYTDLLADLLAELLPAGDGARGQRQHRAGAFKPALGGRGDVARWSSTCCATSPTWCAARAHRQARRAGARARAALLPRDRRRDDRLLRARPAWRGGRASGRWRSPGSTATAAARALHEHLGVCLDLCHAAVEFEDAAECLAAARSVPASASTRCRSAPACGCPRSTPSRSPRCAASTTRSTCTRSCSAGPGGSSASPTCPRPWPRSTTPAGDREWRVHFHVPIFLGRARRPSPRRSRSSREVLAIQRARAVSCHLEVETYTWDVLPEPFRSGSVDEAVARELAWVRRELRA